MPPIPKHPNPAPLTNTPRPPLPLDHFNAYIRDLDPEKKPPQVKFQRIARPPREVLVGRMKIQTSQPDSGHAFVLRRYDTGAISITTLFKAAFPTAPESAEKDEIGWVSHNYDLTGANGGTEPDRVRFSGRWAPPHIAQMLAEAYGLGRVLPILIGAQPDPQGAYRGGGKATPGTPASANRAAPSSAAKSSPAPPPAKRRKEEPTHGLPTPKSSAVPTSPAANDSPARRTREREHKSPSPALVRRSQRARATKSPAPQPARASSRKPLSRGAAASSDATVVGEDTDAEDAAAKLAPTMEDDVREQAELIEDLKRQRAEAAAYASSANDSAAAKRAREEEKEALKFDFKDPETEKRLVVSNPRVRGLRALPPEQKSLAWGALAFAAGVGAVTFLPNFFF